MGKYEIQGTLGYMDPLFKNHWDAYKNDDRIFDKIACDILKTGIFSMGITLIEVATS